MKEKDLRTSSIGHFLQDLRSSTETFSRGKVTQAEVSKRTGIKRSTYADIESGKKKNLSLDDFILIVEKGLRKDPDQAFQKYRKLYSGKSDTL